jgi:hypothetical protein
MSSCFVHNVILIDMVDCLVRIAENATVFGAGKCRDIATLPRIGPIVPAATKDLNPITTSVFGT